MSKSINEIQILSVDVNKGNYFGNHGIIILIKGLVSKKFDIDLKNCCVNIFGDILSVIPIRLRDYVRWYLPVELNSSILLNFTQINSSINEFDEFSYLIGIGTNYFHRIPHQVFLESLNHLISDGDPPIEIVFTSNNVGKLYREELFSIFTKPSLIKDSLEKGINCIYAGNINENLRNYKKSYYPIFKWLTLPLLFTLLTLILFSHDNTIKKVLPVNKSYFYLEDDDFPPIPTNLMKSWELSKLVYLFQNGILVKKNYTSQMDRMNKIDQIMIEVGNILNVPYFYRLSTNYLKEIKGRVIYHENNPSFLIKFYNGITIYNIIFIITCFFIGVSLISAIYYITLPYHNFIIVTAKILWKKIIYPLHTLGYLVIIIFGTSLYLIINGLRYPNEYWNLYSFLGLIISTLGFIYNFLFFCPFSANKSIYILNSFWLIIIYHHFSIHHGSLLLTLISIIGLYCCIFYSYLNDLINNFYRKIYPKDKHATSKWLFPAFIFVLSIIFFEIIGRSPTDFNRLYRLPMLLLSLNLIFIILLFYLSSMYDFYGDYNRIDFIIRQISLFIIMTYLVGSDSNNRALKNISYCHFFISLTFKYTEFHIYMKKNRFLLGFINSCIVILYAKLAKKYDIFYFKV